MYQLKNNFKIIIFKAVILNLFSYRYSLHFQIRKNIIRYSFGKCLYQIVIPHHRPCRVIYYYVWLPEMN